MTDDPDLETMPGGADLFRLLAENVLDYAVFVIDADRHVRTWGLGAERLFGYAEAEIVRRSADVLFTPEDREAGQPENEVRQALAEGRGEDDRWHVRKDGSRFWSAGVLTPLRDEAGRLHGFAKIMRDQTALHEADEARRTAQERLARAALLLANVQDAVIVTDLDGVVTYWNNGAARLFGWTSEEMLGRHYADRFEEPVRSWVADQIRLRGEGVEWEGEFEDYRKDGSRVWIDSRVRLMRDESGTPIGVIGVSRDINARKRAEAAVRANDERLRESEARLRRVVETNAVGLIVADFTGRLVEANDAFLDAVGYSQDDLRTGRLNFLALTPPEYRPLDERAMAEMLRTGRHEPFEKEYVRKDGSRVPVLVGTAYLGKGPDGNDQGVGFIVDLSRQKAAERALRESERRFRGLMEQAPFSVQVFSADGRIVRANRAWEELWGVTPDQIPEYNIFHDRQLETRGVLPLIRRAFEGEAVRTPAIRYDPDETIPGRTRNEEPVRWVASVVYPLRDGGGRVREVVAVHEDMTARVRVEAALRESEDRFRGIAEKSVTGIAEVDLAGRFVFVNDRQCEILGRSREELLAGLRMQDVTHPDDLPRNLPLFERLAREGTPFLIEKRYVRPDGSTVWVSNSVSAVRDAEGRVRTVLAVSVDVTDRKRAEEALREGDERLRLLTDSTAEAIYGLDLDGNCTFCNAACVRLLGYRSKEELLGRNMHRLVHHSFADGRPYPEGDCKVAVAFRRGEGVHAEDEVYWRKDGTSFPAEYRSHPVERDGRLIGSVVTFLDITERKRAEVALRRQAGQFRSLAAASATINSSLSKESVLQVVTEEARFVVGAHQAVSSLSENERWAQAINTVSLSDKYRAYRTYAAEPDGSGIYSLVCRTNKPMRLTQEELGSHPAWKNFGGDRDHPPMRGWLAAPLVGRDGRNLGLIQLSDKEDGGDFTEEDEAILVQLAQTASVALENARLYDELRDADRRKDEFLAMLAHELRNPLAPIRSGLDLLKMSQAEPDVVEVMSDQVGHVVRLVDDLLDVSRILRGKVELKKEPTDLVAVLRRAAETVRPRTVGHRQRLVVSLPDESASLDADPVRLTQVVSNLLNNASKYTDDGGEVRLEAERRDGEVVIRVSDTGIGIEPTLLPKVFDLFTQADQALDRSQGGLGIGLTVVKSLVEMHGGSVEAWSEGIGRGATFTVRLPTATAATETADGPAADAPVRCCRILVVDDNAPAAKLLGRLLGKLGDHSVLAAHDGPSALAAAEEFRPDLILLDIGLPRMDGYEVARRLRERPAFRDTLLVALTGYGTTEDRRRSLEAGFDDHLVKPPGVDLLRKVLAHPKLKA